MKQSQDWFTVDKTGLAKLLEKKGKAFAVFELIQNAWDTDARNVRVKIGLESRVASVYVEDDDPNGFQNLAHTFTLFAESQKKGDPSKRGRFNLGEKLVLALCESAEVISTKGSVYFTKDGRKTGPKKLQAGSAFLGQMRMTKAELADIDTAVSTLIPPPLCQTTYNGAPLPERPAFSTFSTVLPTEISDAEGYLRKTQRQAEVTLHKTLPGETTMLYEMGIPVVELTGGERWHVNVHQKVPLNIDRDNVTPAYLQTLRVAVANATAELLNQDDVTQVWMSAATEDSRVSPEVMSKFIDERFGRKRATQDPSDVEANKQLMDEGFTIIPGRALSKAQWDNVRTNGLVQPAGQIRPSGIKYSPDGRPENVVDPSKYTDGQRGIIEYTKDLSEKLLGRRVEARIVSEITRPHDAWFGNGCLTFNLGRLSKAWFEEGIRPKQNELILHEFAHDKVSDHLTRDFSDEVGRLGAKLAALVLEDPTFFVHHGMKGSV